MHVRNLIPLDNSTNILFKESKIRLWNGDFNQNNKTTVIIGTNGVGKSRILREITQSARKIGKSIIDIEGDISQIIAISTGIHDKFPLSNERFKQKIETLTKTQKKDWRTRYTYIGTRTGAKTSNASKIHIRILESIAMSINSDQHFHNLEKVFDFCGFQSEIMISFKFRSNDIHKYLKKISTPDHLYEYIIDNISDKSLISKTGILRTNKIFQELLKNFISRNFEKDNQLLYQIDFRDGGNGQKFFTDELIVFLVLKELKIVEIDEFYVFKKNSNQIFNLLDAGSGELKRFLILFSVASLASDNSLILIDEPEISMHPQWQADFIPRIKEITNHLKGCHIIIATHAPYLLSSLNDNDSTISIMKKDEVLTFNGSTFGWSIEKILLDVFGMATVRNYYFQRKIEDILNYLLNKEDIQLKGKAKKAKRELAPFVRDEHDPLKNLIDKFEKLL